MPQQRPFIVRGILACLMALGGLFVASRLSLGATMPLVQNVAAHRAAMITSTGSLELSPEDGTFIEVPTNLPGVQNGFAIWGDCNNDEALDVLLAGQVSPTLKIARVYQRSTGNNYIQTTSLTDVVGAAAGTAPGSRRFY